MKTQETRVCVRDYMREWCYFAELLEVFKPVYERIFEYFPLNIDIRIRFVAIFKAEYYSNIRIFLYKYFRILVFKNHLKYLN